MSTSSASNVSHLPALGEVCPWCEQPIPHEKFAEIRERIRANEQAQTRVLERRLHEEHEAALATAQAAADARVEQARKLFDAQAAEARAKAEAAVKSANEQVEAARDEERKKSQKAVAAASAETARVQAEADKRLAEQKAREESESATRLREQREVLDRATEQAVNTEKAKAFADRQKFETRLAQLQRQVAQKTADELGEGAEVDLYEQLKEEFPEDRIKRVKKGQPGADILHTVFANGRECGRIIYDSKNHGAWRNAFVTQLSDDKLAAKADHAILASRVFPSGQSQLCTQGGVIIANPARVAALASVIRKHIVHVATLRLSDVERTEKMTKLYDFINSDRCGQLLEQIETVSDKLLDLDVKEHKAHTITWKQRGHLVREIQQVKGTLVTEIDLIVTAPVVPLREAT
jgi:hypothetical protein